jgi:carboxyl-terminal processing protease
MAHRTTFAASWMVAFSLLAGLGRLGWADPIAPGPDDRHIVSLVTSSLKRDHLLRHPLDKEISERCLRTFLKMLDSRKLYFYQSDIDEFNKHKDELSAALEHKDISFAYLVFRTFLERVDERVRTVDQLLAGPLDFTQYPRTAAEATDRWRQQIKYELLVLKADKKDGKEARDKLARRYRSFAKRMHQTNSEELLEMYLNAFTTAFDPHTDYMSPDTQKNFVIAMSLELEGVGASLQSDDGYTVVKKIVPGGAADKDGRIKVEDKIVGVGQGEKGEIVDVVDMKLNDVVKLIRGPRGTIVRLEVTPADGGRRKCYSITREKIELKDSEARGAVFDAGRKPGGAPYRVGVIELPSFYRDMEGDCRNRPDFKSTTRDVHRILDDFKQQAVDAVVLDLRRNGGGALSEAISLTGLFINDGPVVQVKDADGSVRPYYDPEPGIVWSGPLVVLISKFSASASEILAGAIQDYNRGLIVGDHATHGKGTVQSMLDLGLTLFQTPNELGALKITMQQFYRPDGDSTQKRGVRSDVELPSLTSHLDVGEADLDYPMAFDKVKPQSFKRFDDVSPVICEQLGRLSQQRVQNSEKFQKVVRDIARYQEQKAKKRVTLNEAQFLKERAELNADKEEEKAIEKHNGLTDLGIERDYYLDEALAIAADYLNIERLAKTRPESLGANRN